MRPPSFLKFSLLLWFLLSQLVTLGWAPNPTGNSNLNEHNGLLDAFRAHYAQFQALLVNVYTKETDTFLLQLLGEDLEEFDRIAERHSNIFEVEELQVLRTGVQLMLGDLRALYNQQIEASHSGRPAVIFSEYTGNCGRPRTVIHPEFLRWAYGHTTTSGLSHFLGISRRTVRRRLLDAGVTFPGVNPFPTVSSEDSHDLPDPILDGQVAEPMELPEDVQAQAASIASRSPVGYLSTITDEQLDALINQLRIHYSRAGIRMID
ncbi:hypothetical protein BDP27DRAFT_1450660, partial [Rhodocollybia butyracea]